MSSMKWIAVGERLPEVGGTYAVGGWRPDAPAMFDQEYCTFIKSLDGPQWIQHSNRPLHFMIQYWHDHPPAPSEGKAVEDCGNCHFCLQGKTDASGFPLIALRMILCPTCGNKRCPKASDHRLSCTDSNEAGQPGSVYHKFNASTEPHSRGTGERERRKDSVNAALQSDISDRRKSDHYYFASDRAVPFVWTVCGEDWIKRKDYDALLAELRSLRERLDAEEMLTEDAERRLAEAVKALSDCASVMRAAYDDRHRDIALPELSGEEFGRLWLTTINAADSALAGKPT